jgi:hypothetical protein
MSGQEEIVTVEDFPEDLLCKVAKDLQDVGPESVSDLRLCCKLFRNATDASVETRKQILLGFYKGLKSAKWCTESDEQEKCIISYKYSIPSSSDDPPYIIIHSNSNSNLYKWIFVPFFEETDPSSCSINYLRVKIKRNEQIVFDMTYSNTIEDLNVIVRDDFTDMQLKDILYCMVGFIRLICELNNKTSVTISFDESPNKLLAKYTATLFLLNNKFKRYLERRNQVPQDAEVAEERNVFFLDSYVSSEGIADFVKMKKNISDSMTGLGLLNRSFIQTFENNKCRKLVMFRGIMESMIFLVVYKRNSAKHPILDMIGLYKNDQFMCVVKDGEFKTYGTVQFGLDVKNLMIMMIRGLRRKQIFEESTSIAPKQKKPITFSSVEQFVSIIDGSYDNIQSPPQINSELVKSVFGLISNPF